MVLSIITILKGTNKQQPILENEVQIPFDILKNWVIHGIFIKHLFRYQKVRLLTYDLRVLTKPFLSILLLRLLTAKDCELEDESGSIQEITITKLLTIFFNFIKDIIHRPIIISRTIDDSKALFSTLGQKKARTLNLSNRPIYLRTDLWFGVDAGGSVGHIAGVLNSLDEFTGCPIFFTTDIIPTVRSDIHTFKLLPGQRFWDFNEVPSLYSNSVFATQIRKSIGDNVPAFIYQRYSLNNYTGVQMAQEYDIQFVLEYNGSEVWINKNWGKPLKYEKLSERIELLNLHAADVVVVVSQPMKDELVARGIEPGKILVNPNGVDPDKYSPDINGSDIRTKYSFDNKVVLGFIGTFGKWHGADVLAEAFGLLLERYPHYRQSLRLLMIGDGATMPLVKEKLAQHRVQDLCTFTGMVPQEEGPHYLAACDVLVSPHVPNPDGTPFFGSPTKLFEYMAMGKGIVASDLDQIGEILEHGQTAWMVKPGDVESLAEGLRVLIEDEDLRKRLGQAARQEVVGKFTWKQHTAKIIDKLKQQTTERA